MMNLSGLLFPYFKAQYWKTYTTAYTVFKDLDHDNKEDMIMLYPSFENTLGSDSIIIKKKPGRRYVWRIGPGLGI